MTGTAKPLPLRASMALDSLREQCEYVADLESKLSEGKRVRNELIQDAIEGAEVPYRKVINVTRLSRAQLYNIVNKPERA